jgi:hypothetical protein
MVKIKIDTKEDSPEDIKKVIAFLEQYASSVPNAGSLDLFSDDTPPAAIKEEPAKKDTKLKLDFY